MDYLQADYTTRRRLLNRGIKHNDSRKDELLMAEREVKTVEDLIESIEEGDEGIAVDGKGEDEKEDDK